MHDDDDEIPPVLYIMGPPRRPKKINRQEPLPSWWDEPIEEAELNVMADFLAAIYDQEHKGGLPPRRRHRRD